MTAHAYLRPILDQVEVPFTYYLTHAGAEIAELEGTLTIEYGGDDWFAKHVHLNVLGTYDHRTKQSTRVEVTGDLLKQIRDWAHKDAGIEGLVVEAIQDAGGW